MNVTLMRLHSTPRERAFFVPCVEALFKRSPFCTISGLERENTLCECASLFGGRTGYQSTATFFEQEGNGPINFGRQVLWKIQVQILVASTALVASKQPQRSNLTSYLKPATLISLVSMCILPLTAILVASEAMAASKRPRRSHLISELNSVTSITYVLVSLWLPKASMR